MYALHIENGGRIGTIHRLDPPTGLQASNPDYQRQIIWDRVINVPLDPTDSQNQRFVSWNQSQQPIVDLSVLPEGLVFLGIEPLVAWCKHTGLMLHTRPGLGGFATEAPHRPGGTTTFVCLSVSRASSPTSGYVEPKSGIDGTSSYMWVPESLLTQLNNALPDEEGEVRRISSKPFERVFAYVDVSDFSKMPAGRQVLVVNDLQNIASNPRFWKQTAWPEAALARVEAKLCIGDGYIFVLKEPTYGTYFAAHLARLIEMLVARRKTHVEFHFRMGVHFGPINCFWDSGRLGWNYIGDGINGGQRVLGTIKDQDDVVFISGQVREHLNQDDEMHLAPLLVKCLENRGRRADKHGNLWRVYEVNHTLLTEQSLLPGHLESGP
jgi:hypothetical protein